MEGKMKKSLWIAFGLATVLASGLAVAQSSNAVRAEIPFAFQVSGNNLPSGTYTIQSTAPGVLSLSNYEKKASAMVLTHAAQRSRDIEKGTLVFHRYGSTYFLSEVWSVGNSIGCQLRKSKAEVEMAKAAPVEDKILVAAHR
jgi:hypothetical protein